MIHFDVLFVSNFFNNDFNKKLLDISENLLVSFKGLLILGSDFVIQMDNDATQMDDDQLYRNYE